MNILVGVCGIGFGHCNRQLDIINQFQTRGHKVVVLTYGRGVDFFKNKKITVEKVWVPFIPYKNGVLDVPLLIQKNVKNFIPGIMNNRVIRRDLLKSFSPDVVISDYEPVAARIAYRLNRPLILIDQQSKYLYLPKESIDGYSYAEEEKRLNLFFPKFTKRIIYSFFAFDLPNGVNNVTILPAAIRPGIFPNLPKVPDIVVYFSQYGNSKTNLSDDELCDIFQEFPKYMFHVFKTSPSRAVNRANVQFHQFQTDLFAKKLSTATGVITTAGHSLIAEAVFTQTPLFSIPLGTYDQHFCARQIEAMNIGCAYNQLNRANLFNFITNLDMYNNNIAIASEFLKNNDTLIKIVDEVESYENG